MHLWSINYNERILLLHSTLRPQNILKKKLYGVEAAFFIFFFFFHFCKLKIMLIEYSSIHRLITNAVYIRKEIQLQRTFS